MGAARVPWRAVKELRKTNKKWADEGGRGELERLGGLAACGAGGEDGGKGQHFFAPALPPCRRSLSPLRDVQFNFGESWNGGRWEGDSAHVESFLSIRCWRDVGVIPLFPVPHGEPTSSAPPIESNLQHSLR